MEAAYKPDISDVRESPALDIIHLFKKHKSEVCYCDPFVKEIDLDGIKLSAELLTKDLLNSSDCVVIVTNHKSFDYDLISEESKIIIDARNVYGGKNLANVIPL